MIYAETAKEIEEPRKAFLRKWRLKCRAVADSLEEAGDRAVHFHPPAARPMALGAHHQCRRRLHEEFKRRIKTQTVLPSPETAAMLLGAARLRTDHYAQGRRLADAGYQTNRRGH